MVGAGHAREGLFRHRDTEDAEMMEIVFSVHSVSLWQTFW